MKLNKKWTKKDKNGQKQAKMGKMGKNGQKQAKWSNGQNLNQ